VVVSISSPVFPSIRPSRHTRTATAHTHRNAETRCLTSTSPSRPAPHQNRLPTLSRRLLTQNVENTSLLLQTAPPTNATASKPTTPLTPNTNHANTPFFLSPHPHRNMNQNPRLSPCERINWLYPSTILVPAPHTTPPTIFPCIYTVFHSQYYTLFLSASALSSPKQSPHDDWLRRDHETSHSHHFLTVHVLSRPPHVVSCIVFFL
jgi:hypothetical protein